jgi:hypothetical protein
MTLKEITTKIIMDHDGALFLNKITTIRKVPYPSFILEEVKRFQDPKSLFIFGDIDDALKLRYLWL